MALIVKGKEGEMTFVVTDVDMKVPPEAGDKVIVSYTDKSGKMVARSVISVKGAKKTVKKEAKVSDRIVAQAK